MIVLALGALFNAGAWVWSDLMPPGDFPGYAAQVQRVRDALLAYGYIPRWCVECYGGSSVFTPQFKEILAFPLAVLFDPITATKGTWLLLRVISGLGIYACALRLLGAPGAGLVAGYACAFGAMSNAQNGHLDMALAAALLPFLWLSLVEHFRCGGWGWTLAVGALTACLFASNWVYAFVAPFAAAMLVALRPWPGRALAEGSALRSLAALGVFLAFAAAPLAWLIADAPNHGLIDPELTAAQREIYVERSPFLYFNRSGWLDGWLATHHPTGFDLPGWDGAWRYLGFSVLLSSAAGWWVSPRHSTARLGMGAVFGLLVFQYWLSLGPHTLLWELSESFGWSEATESALRSGLWAVAAVAVTAAGFCLWRKRRGCEALLSLALLGVLPTLSLWNGFAALPPFAVQRSPGHFFDTAQVWLCLAFAGALAALLRQMPSVRARHALLSAVGVAVCLDFAPSRDAYAETPLAPLRATAELMSGLDGEAGTLRVALPPGYPPRASWVMAHSEAGHASGWLSWQSGRHWEAPLRAAAYSRSVGLAGGRARIDPDSATLAELRVRYFLLPRERLVLGEPWRRLNSAGPFTLWEQPSVQPLARGLRSLSVRETAFAVAASRPHPEHIRLDLDAGNESGWVLLSESHHPWWRARVDGEAVAVERAAETLMAIPVSAGRHQLDLRFRPPVLLRLAGILTATAWLGLAAAVGFAGWERLRRGL